MLLLFGDFQGGQLDFKGGGEAWNPDCDTLQIDWQMLRYSWRIRYMYQPPLLFIQALAKPASSLTDVRRLESIQHKVSQTSVDQEPGPLEWQ